VIQPAHGRVLDLGRPTRFPLLVFGPFVEISLALIRHFLFEGAIQLCGFTRQTVPFQTQQLFTHRFLNRAAAIWKPPGGEAEVFLRSACGLNISEGQDFGKGIDVNLFRNRTPEAYCIVMIVFSKPQTIS